MKKRFNSLLGVILVGAVVGLAACGGPSVESNMKEIKQAFKGAMDAKDMPELTKQAASLQAAIQAASKVEYKKGKPEGETYRTGMVELNQEMVELNQAIGANDMAKAKEILAKAGATKDKYHKLLKAD